MNDIFASLQKVRDFFKNQITRPAGPPLKILLLGLDSAGKTSFLYKLNKIGGGKNKIETKMPAITFFYEELKFNGTMIIARDVGGRDQMLPNLIARKLGHYKHIDGIIFMVDSVDDDRIDMARDQLHFIVDEDELNGGRAPLLIICNKQDLPKALPPDKITALLDVPGIQRKWQAFGTTSRGNSIHEAFEWLVATIRDKDNPDTDTVTTDDSTAGSESVFSSTMDMVGIGYDPTAQGSNQTLQHFLPIKLGTDCPFAKAANLWGGSPCPDGSTIEDQAKANIAALSEFVHRSRSGEKLDGFCIELVDEVATKGKPRELGESVRRLLTVLSDNDPAGEGLMRKRYIGERGWRFRFDKADFFITTFAPCYPPTSSRYAFGTGKAFLLLQPMVSFERLLPDTPKTNWDAPQTMRDKARVAFRDVGRGYHIPKTTQYPPAEHTVKPLNDDGASIIRWWEPL